jgi:hypothetical protein
MRPSHERLKMDAVVLTPASPATQTVRAEIVGENRASALGVTAHSTSPVLLLCRKLIAAGVDPGTLLEAYRRRGDTDILCLKVRTIGEGAAVQVNTSGTGFAPYRIHAPSAALPMRSDAAARVGAPRRRPAHQRGLRHARERRIRQARKVVVTGLRTSGAAS